MQDNSVVVDQDGQITSNPDTVQAIDKSVPNRTLKIRFARNDSTAKLAPKYKGYLYLDGALNGAVLECPIFEDPEKGIGTSLPGGRFAALKAAPRVIVDRATEEEHLVFGASADPIGQTLLSKWNPAIIDAFGRYRLSITPENPNGCPEQFVFLGQ